jgi:hypothetical protein
LGRKEAREWEGGGNVMNVVFQSYSIFEYTEEGDNTKDEWMLRTCWLVLGVVREGLRANFVALANV